MFRKSIPREELESAFVALLDPLRTPAALTSVARAMFADLWAVVVARAQLDSEHVTVESQVLELKISRLRERIAAGTEPSLRAIYESRVRTLEEQNNRLLEQRDQRTQRKPDFEHSLAAALTFLAQPAQLWRCGSLDYRRAVLKFAFADPLLYRRGEGFRIAAVAVPFTPIA